MKRELRNTIRKCFSSNWEGGRNSSIVVIKDSGRAGS